MKYSNEIKIGIAIVLSILVFYIGTRFFRDLPVFAGTNEFTTTFADAGGLVSGNAVRINGVNVGSVSEVRLENGQARVVFNVNKDVVLTQGTTASIGGFSVLGVVRLDILLGPPDATAHAAGDYIPSAQTSGLDQLITRAPEIVGHADSLMLGATETLAAARTLMADPQSDLAQTLVAIQGSANALSTLLRAEQDRISGVLEGVETLTGNLNTLTRDSLTATVGNVNALLAQIDQNMASLEATTTSLNAILGKTDFRKGSISM